MDRAARGGTVQGRLRWLAADGRPQAAAFDGYRLHPTTDLMAERDHWTAVPAREGVSARAWPEGPDPARAGVNIEQQSSRTAAGVSPRPGEAQS
jgi:hypothetical protein